MQWRGQIGDTLLAARDRLRIVGARLRLDPSHPGFIAGKEKSAQASGPAERLYWHACVAAYRSAAGPQ